LRHFTEAGGEVATYGGGKHKIGFRHDVDEIGSEWRH
jgi:hypothetical protein